LLLHQQVGDGEAEKVCRGLISGRLPRETFSRFFLTTLIVARR